MLAQPDPLTAIVCALDLAALGLYRAAAARGRGRGRALSVIACDGGGTTLLDRLTHHGESIETGSESWRFKTRTWHQSETPQARCRCAI